MFKLLCLGLIFLQFSVEDSFCMECRHAVSMHYGKAKKPPFKQEGSITCENEEQVCARVHVRGTIGSYRVSTHVASCMNETMCYEDDFCSIENLVNMSHVAPYSKVRSCSTECCFHDNCNVHRKITTPPPPKLKCYDGKKEYDSDGKLISDDMKSRACLFSPEGMARRSRCMLAQVSSTHAKTNSTLLTTFSSCVHKPMCESITCEVMAMELASKEDYIMGDCRITCCSTPLCNKSHTAVFSRVTILLMLLFVQILSCQAK